VGASKDSTNWQRAFSTMFLYSSRSVGRLCNAKARCGSSWQLNHLHNLPTNRNNPTTNPPLWNTNQSKKKTMNLLRWYDKTQDDSTEERDLPPLPRLAPRPYRECRVFSRHVPDALAAIGRFVETFLRDLAREEGVSIRALHHRRCRGIILS
jgi:hypothetical protein